MLDTITVAAQLFEQSGAPAAGARLALVLSEFEIDAAVVVPRRVEVTADSNGECSVEVWPNSAGEHRSHYVVRAVSANDDAVLLQGYAVFPDAQNVTLQDYLTQSPPDPPDAIARRNLVLLQGYDFPAVYTLIQPDCSPADLTSYIPRLRVYDAPGGALVFDTDSDAGVALSVQDDQLLMTIAAAAFAGWISGYFYTLDLTFAGTAHPVVYGAVFIQP